MDVDYDTYAGMSPLKRSQTRLSPENRAEIVKTHWTRFLDANRARLNAEQIAFIEERIASVRPELYSEDRPRTEEEYKQIREMEAQFFRLFARDDMMKLSMEAFNLSGGIRNPLARALVRRRYEKSGELDAAFVDMMRMPPGELRGKRPDLPALLGIAEDEFWPFVDDEEVWFAAQRGRALTHTIRNPLALILLDDVPRADDAELAQALRDLRDGRPRNDLLDFLRHYYDGIPTGDVAIDDDDVRLAASRAYFFVSQPWMRAEMQRQRDQRR
ncbi:MAG TPA: hypothetical protein VKU62_01095 [Thermoanaerobaculia bacterium]|nr:hypothetical protein [Thermoanaerobaculia bacterium]